MNGRPRSRRGAEVVSDAPRSNCLIALRALALLLASMLMMIACAEEAPRSRPADVDDAYDAIYALGGSEPLLFAPPATWLDRDGARMAELLERAQRIDPSSLPDAARVVTQNDVWGLHARIAAVESSSAPRERVLRAAADLVRHLAAPPPRAPRAVDTLLPASEGWRELESELPSMMHERAFGLRRVFHVRQRERGGVSRAIYSTLVAIDPSGRAIETSIVGDLEILRFDGDGLVAARLFELDRRAAREGRPFLIEAARAEHVPGNGADSFLATFDPPAALSTLPCARCHEDAHPMSLPSETLPLGRRTAALLEQLEPTLELLRADQR